MAVSIGKIKCFDNTSETWQNYEERLGQYFIANGVKDEKKVPALLALIGPTTYAVLRDLTSPTVPSEKSYNELTTLLQTHFNPKPLTIAERFRFYKRDQRAGESVQDFNISLRKLSQHCNFGDGLNEALRDRFVCGLRNENIQKKLLSEKDLTYEKSIEIATTMELASRDVNEVHGKAISVDKVSASDKFPKKNFQKGNKDKQFKPPINKPKVELGCFRCLRKNHTPEHCKFKDSVCYTCGKKGHIAPACKSVKGKSKAQVHQMSDEEVEDEEVSLFNVRSNTNGRDIIWVTPVIEGDIIRPLGVISVKAELNGQSEDLNLYVVEKGNRPILGREWLHLLKLNWAEIKALQYVSSKSLDSSEVENLMKARYGEIFQDNLGHVKNVKAKLRLKKYATPRFHKARPVPLALKPKIEKELETLLEAGMLEKVDYSEWATPIVPVPKSNGEIRICGDFKVTVNPLLEIDQYPLPRIEDIFASIGAGKKFWKIDLKNAYLQVEVDEESKKLLTINTHKGLFRYNCLVFGVAPAAAIFQRLIEQIVSGIPGVQVILDDMIVTGATDEEHLANLEQALKRLQDNGFRLNVKKCAFFQEEIEFCGHKIDGNGLHKTEDKIKAMVNAPNPTNVKELRSFLGLIQYYAKFLPDLATILHPLHKLLAKDAKWDWTPSCENAVMQVKEMIASDCVLMNYNPELPVLLACDSSSYGIGAVLSHKLPDGSDRPIAFASRSLNSAEKNYSQIDKEALALVWGVKKFNVYLYGRKFTLVTDHRPLTSIFNPCKAVSSTTASRLQRYAIFLAGYQYDIQFKGTKAHGNCDALSRLPLSGRVSENSDPMDVYLHSVMDTLPVTAIQIANATRWDKILSQVYDMVQHGWSRYKPDSVSLEIDPYWNRRNELFLHQGCLMWGCRVVVPEALQQNVLEEVHSGHLGGQNEIYRSQLYLVAKHRSGLGYPR
ncbi:uncharacterized protein K02A2.6-like [Mercenaria mercenaria]|uniref:uncharacterized protein K02A2.6-like n=1 Tax=Mercenaria mercenaria TaxID=6596 RepID=UPI00234E6C0A|nr:uncharacterized protein K02A2.6-like [Mercenaria mercenaria]